MIFVGYAGHLLQLLLHVGHLLSTLLGSLLKASHLLIIHLDLTLILGLLFSIVFYRFIIFLLQALPVECMQEETSHFLYTIPTVPP